jgi:hypothetical protein
VILPATIRAKLAVVALVLVTLLYGSACSTTCALSACPNEAQNAATHDCDHNASVPAHQQTPQNPDCPKHHHPTFDAVKSDALAQAQPTSRNGATVAQLLAVTPLHAAFTLSARATFSDLAPPRNFSSPLDQRVSVLRV